MPLRRDDPRRSENPSVLAATLADSALRLLVLVLDDDPQADDAWGMLSDLATSLGSLDALLASLEALLPLELDGLTDYAGGSLERTALTLRAHAVARHLEIVAPPPLPPDLDDDLPF